MGGKACVLKAYRWYVYLPEYIVAQRDMPIGILKAHSHQTLCTSASME